MSDFHRIKEQQKFKGLIIFLFLTLLIVSFTGLSFGQSVKENKKDETPFPKYGKGKINVRIYTDYFCPPCRASEHKIEPVIEKLVKQNVITITFADTPVNPYSPLYAKYFLYALKAKNIFANAILIRQTLFKAAEKKITDEEILKKHLKQNKIAFTPFDVKSVFTKLNEFLNNDKIRATPSCVIEKNGKSETFIGGEAILNALKALE